MLNIGMDMSQILLPQITMVSNKVKSGDNAQINSSSIYSYLNMRGLGRNAAGNYNKRKFNAIPYLSYWDIYKNYFANKMEERGYVIHASEWENGWDTFSANVTSMGVTTDVLDTEIAVNTTAISGFQLVIVGKWQANDVPQNGEPNLDEIMLTVDSLLVPITTLFENVVYENTETAGNIKITCTNWQSVEGAATDIEYVDQTINNTIEVTEGRPQLTEFPLENIDDMRMDILESVRDTTAFIINQNSNAPYGLGLGYDYDDTTGEVSKEYKLASQEGLGIKTYQSDLFNNWISTEWIDGSNGINEVTAVSTAGNEFTIDSLNLANKVYNMLNRIAISGGSYDDWLDAVYTHERSKSCENPMYLGSLIKELGFEEVVSVADTEVGGEEQPLGTLAGRGRLTGKNKGGKVKVKIDEPSYIIGLVSLTPRIDYSQGNKWDTNLKTMNDFHKPALDEIGYQDLITDQMAWFDTTVTESGDVVYSTAGKQPAWINYMTNVNQTRGNFAEANQEMFMTLNRRYEEGLTGIQDLTTYIDPSKYNNIFAQTSLDSQNFWVQISNKITARRKMSAKVIPNL
jgi:hypothetical protein